ncbi:MAG: hypothetical protein ACYCYG_12260 [Bellilinea sp.]
MTLPTLALALAYWLHIIATVMWVGGIMTLSVLVIPAARRTLETKDYVALLGRLQEGLQRVGWLSLAVLVGTGMFQMAAHPSYDGLLGITNNWAVAIFIKHLVISLMVLVSAYLTWGLMPALRRIALQRAAGLTVDEEKNRLLQRRESLVLTINLVLSIIVLLFTAIARST